MKEFSTLIEAAGEVWTLCGYIQWCEAWLLPFLSIYQCTFPAKIVSCELQKNLLWLLFSVRVHTTKPCLNLPACKRWFQLFMKWDNHSNNHSYNIKFSIICLLPACLVSINTGPRQEIASWAFTFTISSCLWKLYFFFLCLGLTNPHPQGRRGTGTRRASTMNPAPQFESQATVARTPPEWVRELTITTHSGGVWAVLPVSALGIRV